MIFLIKWGSISKWNKCFLFVGGERDVKTNASTNDWKIL